MIHSRDVVAIEHQLRQDLDRNRLEALLVAAADGLQQTELDRTASYNRLYGLLSETIDRLVAPDPPRLLKDLMRHPHPKVFYLANGRYYWEIDADVAESTAKAIAEANPESTPLGREARQAILNFERNRKWGDTPATRASSPPSSHSPPPEPPPVLVAVSRQELREMAVENECSALLPILSKVAWPSIRLGRFRLEVDDLPVGASKLGGTPDMPDDLTWPRFQDNPLSFIGQIDLGDITRFRDFTHLPPDGHLLFFYEADLQPWGYEDLEPGWSRVIYLAPGATLKRRPPPPDLYEELRFPPARLDFLEDVTLPAYDIGPMNEDPADGHLELSDEQRADLERLQGVLDDYRSAENQPIHRMFGYPDEWQGSMYLSSEYEADGEDTDRWRLLLQVDSDYVGTETGYKGMFWGSEGRIYYWAPWTGLPHGRVEGVEVVLQCT